jgi:integrase
VIEHLLRIRGFGEKVFPWPQGRDRLWEEFSRLQILGGVRRGCRGDHTHTRRCKPRGFHAIRRSLATYNLDRLGPREIQSMMQHKQFSTTER